MSAIPIPRKTSSETYDVDGFIDQLLASRKFDELTEVFADKTAYKIKNLDNPPTTRTDIERIRWSKKSHKNTDKEQFKDDHTQTELISIKLRDDDTHSKESRKRKPIISLKDGEVSPNENLRLKYKYLTKNAKTKNSTDHNRVMILEKKDNNEEHALNDNENDDLKEEAKNEDQNDSNGSHEKHEQYHNDRDGDLHYKNAKIDHVRDKEDHKYEHSFQEDLNKSENFHLQMDDNAKDGTHPNEEHTDRVRPEFKIKAYSVEHEHAHNTSDEISEENFQGVASDEKSHEEIDHRKEVTLIREPTTTSFKVEAVTNVTNSTIQKDHTNDDMIGTAHFRAQVSEEQVQAKSEEKERRIRNLPDSELKKLLKQHPTDKEMRTLNDKLEFTQVKQDSEKPGETERNQKDKLEKEKREREVLEKILKDRLEEEERLRNAAVIYERSEREQRALFGIPENEESVEEIPSDHVIMGDDININEKPRHILEKEIREESKRQEKQHAEWAKKVEKELEEHKENMKKESDKYHKEEQERLNKVLKDKEKYEAEMAESSKAYVAANLEQANKVLKEKAKNDEMMKEESDNHEKHQYDRLKELLKEKAKHEEEMKQESMLLAKQAKERLAKLLGPKKTFIEKVIDKKKELENKIKGMNVKSMKAKKKGPEKGTKKESMKDKKEESKKDKKKEPKKEKKNESTKEKKKAKEFDYSDYRAEEEQINTKEKQRQYRDQKEYENKLERKINEDEESSIESESESEVDKQTELQAIPGSKPSFNKVNIKPYKNIEDEYNNRIAESESAANDDDQSSGEDELVIMSSTTNPIIRKEGNKEYAFVQNPEYAEYHEAYAKMQKEHPFNPADFLK